MIYGSLDLTAYKQAYRALLERLSLAAQAEDWAEIRRINDETNTLINCMVAEIQQTPEYQAYKTAGSPVGREVTR